MERNWKKMSKEEEDKKRQETMMQLSWHIPALK